MKESRFSMSQRTPSGEVVRVVSVGRDSAHCETSFGSSVNVYWSSGIPDPLPKAGELWHVQTFGNGLRWMFVSRVPSGDIQRTSYWVDVDWRTCVGHERSVVDDIASAGFDGVLLNVASCSQLAWGNERFGLVGYGDNVTQFVMRANDVGLRVRLSLSADLWSSAKSNGEQALYTQRTIYVSSGTASLATSVFMSPAASAGAVSSIVSELYELYSPFVEGVVIDGFCLDGPYSDFSSSASARFVADGNLLDISSIGLVGSQRDLYDSYQRQAQMAFVSAIRESVGSWALSAIVPSNRFCISSSEIGARATGIWDDFGSYGWTSVGMALDYQMDADSESAMRSLEVECAELVRLSGECPPMARMSIERMPQPMPVMAMMSKYGIPDVVVDDYEMWCSLSDDEVDALRSAMSLNRVSEVSRLQSLGFVVSQANMNMASNKPEVVAAIEGMCGDVIDRVPHALRCLFDSDVEGGSFDGLSSVLVSCCDYLSDAGVKSISDAIGDGYRGFVIVGDVGSASDDGPRQYLPLSERVGGVLYGGELYSGILSMSDVYVAEDSYSIDLVVNGAVPVASDGMAMSASMGENDVVNAPVSITGRSSQVALDVVGDSHLWPVVGNFVSRAVGRES